MSLYVGSSPQPQSLNRALTFEDACQMTVQQRAREEEVVEVEVEVEEVEVCPVGNRMGGSPPVAMMCEK